MNQNKKGQRIKKYFKQEKERLLETEKGSIKKALKNNDCSFLYHQVLTTESKNLYLNHKENFNQENKKLVQKNTKDIVLGS